MCAAVGQSKVGDARTLAGTPQGGALPCVTPCSRPELGACKRADQLVFGDQHSVVRYIVRRLSPDLGSIYHRRLLFVPVNRSLALCSVTGV